MSCEAKDARSFEHVSRNQTFFSIASAFGLPFALTLLIIFTHNIMDKCLVTEEGVTLLGAPLGSHAFESQRIQKKVDKIRGHH